jgi:cytidyltransferase-like protein
MEEIMTRKIYKLIRNKFLDQWKKVRKKCTVIVAVSGYFQVLHVGHVNYITEARKHGGYLIAIINSDKQAISKKTPCVVDEKSRAYVVSKIQGVDETIIAIDEDGTVAKTLEMIKPNVFCNGGDRVPSMSPSKEQKTCDKLGIKMVYNVGGGKSDSSSGILQRAHTILSKESDKICCNSTTKSV